MQNSCYLFLLLATLGVAVVLLYHYHYRADRVLLRLLEQNLVGEFRADHADVISAATFLESELNNKGVRCRVIVDADLVSRRPAPKLVGQGNGILWLHGMMKAFDVSVLIADKEHILITHPHREQRSASPK